MIKASKSLLVLSALLLMACTILPLYPFDFSPKALISYAAVFGFMLIVYLLSVTPSFCFFMLCWKKFKEREDRKYRINIFASSVAIMLSTALVSYPLLSFPPTATESFITPVLLPMTVASYHLIIFVISLVLLPFGTKDLTSRFWTTPNGAPELYVLN